MQQTRGMSRARMAELVDAPASGAGAGNGVEVRVLFRAPHCDPRWALLDISIKCDQRCCRRSNSGIVLRRFCSPKSLLQPSCRSRPKRSRQAYRTYRVAINKLDTGKHAFSIIVSWPWGEPVSLTLSPLNKMHRTTRTALHSASKNMAFAPASDHSSSIG